MHDSSVSAGRAALQSLMLRMAFRLSDRRVIHGFEIANLSEVRHDTTLFGRIEEMLALIEGVEPHRTARMRRSFRRILVGPSGGAAGSYWHFLDACVLSADHLLTCSPASSAMTLIHEATHARLHRAGVPYAPELRERIEAACLRAEIDFGRRIPDAGGLVAEAEAALATRWWECTNQRDRESGQLRALGMPRWLMRLRRILLRY